MTETNDPKVPLGLEPPFPITNDKSQYIFWEGEAELRQQTFTLRGYARILLDLYPFPEFTFDFAPNFNSSQRQTLPKIELSKAILDCGPHFGQIICDISFIDANIAGEVVSKVERPAEIANVHEAVFIIFNGPHILGSPLRRGDHRFFGRLTARAATHEITIDAMKGDAQERNTVYEATHVASCRFLTQQTNADIEELGTHLFRVLSLMRCRWAGILGPWLYDSSGNLIDVQPRVTKTTRNGNSRSWLYQTTDDSFHNLYSCMSSAFQDETRESALQTAIHWLIESEQCAGGIEGALILQQSALECLAWLEIVQVRKLCSESGFKGLPASDKIRWLLSLNNICCDIPSTSTHIHDYAKATNLPNLVTALTDVRNALVHAEPKKAEKLFGRKKGDEERTELWYQIGGVLQQAFLGSIGYKGMIFRRDLGRVYSHQAISLAPPNNE